MFLANTRGDCKLCAQTKCSYNVLSEQGLADKIRQVQGDVDSPKNTSSVKRAAVLIDGLNLLAQRSR